MKALTALTMRKQGVPPSVGAKASLESAASLAAPAAPAPMAPVARLTPVPREPQSDVLFEMFNGSLGSVHLARLLRGHDAGRLVTLRKLPMVRSEELTAAADLARSVAHPKLAKVLGIIEEQNARYLASEHISGVTLFELGRTASNRQLPVLPSVAVRIVMDALNAAEAARSLLTETLRAPAARAVYPECIWIADFGETFLAEVLVAPLLGRKPSEGADASEAGILAEDMRSAALELTRMVCAGLSPDNPAETDLSHLPDELQEVLLPALGYGSMVGYSSPQEFLDALSTLSDNLFASEQQVAEELQRLMGTVLNVRRQKLDMLERGAASMEVDEERSDETKFFRVAVKTEQRVTARPPPNSLPTPVAPAYRPPSPAAGVAAELAYSPPSGRQPIVDPAVQEQSDEPTMLFRRNEDGSGRSNVFGGTPIADEAVADAPSLFQTAVHKRQSYAAMLEREETAPPPAVQPRRTGRVVLALVAVVLVAAGLRLSWLMHREHASLSAVLHEQVHALSSLAKR